MPVADVEVSRLPPDTSCRELASIELSTLRVHTDLHQVLVVSYSLGYVVPNCLVVCLSMVLLLLVCQLRRNDVS